MFIDSSVVHSVQISHFMKFSIIIPAYNEEKYIEKTVRAALRQDIPRKDFEIIVVDNNSTDKTSEVAKRAGADKVVLEKKKGTNMARERGFEESRGKIVAFLDADCAPPKNWLRNIEKLLAKEHAAAISGPYDYNFHGATKTAEKIYEKFAFKKIPEFLEKAFGKRAGAIIGGNFAAPRETIQKIGGLPPIVFSGDDAAIAILIARKVGKVAFSSKLRVKSSPRRFKERGLLNTVSKYGWYYFKTYFSLPETTKKKIVKKKRNG